MRILMLSNLFPPSARGGYELWCEEIAKGLYLRGHRVVVLTSRHGRTPIAGKEPDWIHRELYLEMEFASLRNGITFFTHRKAHEAENLRCLQETMRAFAPDAICIWGMWNLTPALAASAERLLPNRTVYYFGDYWPTLASQYQHYWEAPARNWATAMPKTVLRFFATRMLQAEQPPKLAFARALFPTAFMRDEYARRGIAPLRTDVIYGSVDTRRFVTCAPALDPTGKGVARLLYAGRLTQEKGAHTAIETVGILVNRHRVRAVRLMMVGTGDPPYEERLHHLVNDLQVGMHVDFLGAQPHEAMVEFYREADILLFPSIWQEPFGRVIVEAMAAGKVVVGTGTGGSAEILLDGENGLLTSPDNAEEMACQVLRLIQTPDLYRRLAQRAQETAVERFDTQRMTAEIEAYLVRMIEESPNSASAVGPSPASM